MSKKSGEGRITIKRVPYELKGLSARKLQEMREIVEKEFGEGWVTSTHLKIRAYFVAACLRDQAGNNPDVEDVYDLDAVVLKDLNAKAEDIIGLSQRSRAAMEKN